jgi:hypothetical protein
MLMEPGCHTQQRRVEIGERQGSGKHGMAQTLHLVIAQAAPAREYV